MSPRARSVYLERPSRRRSSYGYSGGRREGGRLRRVGYVMIALFVLVVAGVVAQWLRALPAQHVVRAFPATVTVPGQPPALPWPKEGQAAVAVDGVGTVGSFGSSKPAAIASLAKMMTAFQVLTDHPLAQGAAGSSFTVSSADVADYRKRAAGRQSVLAVRAGERLTEHQALQALLIPSANNVAVLLARWDAGSVSKFVARMNATARRLGLTNTHYADPDGTSPSTVSTAVDQLTLAQAAMKFPVFASIVAQPSATFPVVGKVFNYDYYIGHYGFIGIKTGSDAAAGGCWAFAARRTVAGKRATVYGVVLGQHAKNGELIQPALRLGRRLADAVPHVVSSTTIVAAGTKVGALTAPWRSPVPLVTKQSMTVLAAAGQGYPVTLRLTAPRDRGVTAGTVVGELTVGRATTPIVVAHDASGPTLGWRLTRR